MADLPTVNPMDLVKDARAHLQAAINQSIASDDRIIVEHMTVAEALLKSIIEASYAAKPA